MYKVWNCGDRYFDDILLLFFWRLYRSAIQSSCIIITTFLLLKSSVPPKRPWPESNSFSQFNTVASFWFVWSENYILIICMPLPKKGKVKSRICVHLTRKFFVRKNRSRCLPFNLYLSKNPNFSWVRLIKLWFLCHAIVYKISIYWEYCVLTIVR